MTKIQPTFDQSTEAARIGLINVYSDERGEDAFKGLMPLDVRVFTTRLAADLEAYNKEGKFKPVGGFEGVAGTLPPPGRIDLIAFSCTSGTIATGAEEVATAMNRIHPGVPVTDPATAAVAGFRHLGIRRIALLTPYPASIHSLFVPYLEKQGLAVVADASFDIRTDDQVALVSKQSFIAAGNELLSVERPEALFISCAAFDVVDIIPDIARELNCPVYSSSQLFAWHALELLGLNAPASSILVRSAVEPDK